jgi:alcohol dehydrogenase YqhD (iron-dependent ADH family)
MAGTGSEMDMGGVITVGAVHKKYAIIHPLLNPKFSILDPEYRLFGNILEKYDKEI